MQEPRRYSSLLSCFFLSGFAALLYETAWTREFAFVFGTSELAIAVVLAAYMGGLAVGAAAASRAARRLARPVLVYGAMEAGIALGALLVPAAIRLSLEASVPLFGGRATPPDSGDLGLVAFHLASAFVILIGPTALMGATLPVLARFAVRHAEELGRRVGALYAVNTTGAVVGALAAGFVLLPALGLRATIHVGIAVNVLVVAIAAWIGRDAGAIPAQPPPAAARAGRAWDASARVLPLMLVSGACSFVYEVLWSRLLTHILGGSVYAFATMLASFLAGIALGAAAGARLTRVRAATGLAAAQIGIAVASLAAYWSVDRLPDLALAIGVGGNVDLLPQAGVAATLLLPSTVFIGATYPFAVRIAAGEASAEAAGPSGRVYAWNTLGAIAGAIGTGFFLLPALGYAGTLRVAVTTNAALGVLALLAFAPVRRLAAAIVAAGVAVAALAPLGRPDRVLRFNPYGGFNAGRIEYVGVGRSATVLALAQDERYRIYSNGLPEATIRPIFEPLQELTAKWLTVLPVLARPAARSMLVIGFGGGRSLERVPRTVQRIDVVELESKIIAANRSLSAVRDVDPLRDPRIKVYVNDARGALQLTGAHYDLIVSQPSHPWTAGASNLYTREFFELARRRLAPGGVFEQWIGMDMIDAGLLRSLVATMTAVFPHVRVYRPPPGRAFLFLGSERPLDVEASAARAIAAARRDLARVGVFAPADALAALSLDEAGARRFAEHGEISTDDHNLLQSRSPRLGPGFLHPKEAEVLLAPFDPIERLAPQVDRLYLGRRFLSRGNLRRIKAVSRSEASEDQRLTLYGTAGLAYGRRDAVPALERALSLNPSNATAAFELARAHRAAAEQGRLDFLPDPSLLGASGELVVRGWRQEAAGDWSALRAEDAALAAIPVTDVAWLDANRLRVRWRLASGDPARRREARDLLDTALLFELDPEDCVLRASLAAGDGFPAYALDLLRQARALIPLSSQPAVVATRASALLARIAPGPRQGALYAELKTQFHRLARPR